MNGILRRRRDLMLQTPSEPPNRFIEGTYTKGTSEIVIDSAGDMTINSWGSTTANRPSIPMVRALNFVTGDTVRLVITKLSGTISAIQFCEIWVNSMKVVDNESWGTGSTPITKTITATADAGSVYFTFNNKTGGAAFTNYKVKVEIYVNAVKVFPEV